MHTSSWLIIIQPDPHTTCLGPPCRPVLPLTETGPNQSCLLHVSRRITRQPRDSRIPTVLGGSTSLLARSAGERAASRWHGHMFIPFDFPLRRDSLSLHLWCDRGFSVTLPMVCAWFMTFCHFINIIEEAVRLAPESPFSVTRLIHRFMHIDPCMHRTQGRHLGSLAAM